MNYYIKTILFLFIITLSFNSMAQEKETTKAKTSFEEQTKALNKLEPTTDQQYESWLPKKVGDFKLTSHIINGKIDDTPKNNIQLVYENKIKKIDIIIVDAAKDASSLEMIYFAFDMEKQFSKEKKKQTITKEPHHISKYNEEKKEAQILTIINNRFGVSAQANNINSEELWLFVKKLNIETLN